MEFSEKAIEDLIENAIKRGEKHKLTSRGLYALSGYDKFYRQIDLGSYGRLDLVGIKYNPGHQEIGCKKVINIAVIEIKKGEVNYNTLIQAIRYCKGLQVIAERLNVCINPRIVLIGASICKTDFCYMPDFMDNLYVYTVHINLEKGIIFNSECGYSITENKETNLTNKAISDIRNYMIDQVRMAVIEKYEIPS